MGKKSICDDPEFNHFIDDYDFLCPPSPRIKTCKVLILEYAYFLKSISKID